MDDTSRGSATEGWEGCGGVVRGNEPTVRSTESYSLPTVKVKKRTD